MSSPTGEILLYTDPSGVLRLQVRLVERTL